jgi:hypothetical protein
VVVPKPTHLLYIPHALLTQVRQALGQPSIEGRGIRILCMDGGGMKGLGMITMLRHIERKAGGEHVVVFVFVFVNALVCVVALMGLIGYYVYIYL